jgi:hypothetical protein
MCKLPFDACRVHMGCQTRWRGPVGLESDSWTRFSGSARSFPARKRAAVGLDASFPNVVRVFLRFTYAWSAFQYQTWACSDLTVHRYRDRTADLVTDSLLELRIDGTSYFGGHFYSYRRAPIVAKLQPRTYAFQLRFVHDVPECRISDYRCAS